MKKHFHTYKKILAILPLLFFGFISMSYGQAKEQFEFKLQYMEENGDSLWGVYVRPIAGFPAGSNDAVVGSGQVTILMRNNGLDSITNIQSVGGDWNTNYDFVKGPCEANDISYLFVGLRDGDGILLEDGEETLLFTFQVPGECPDTLGLIHNINDPFIPDNSTCGSSPGVNSAGNNPGQDLSVFNSSTGRIHNWVNNYAPQAYSCGDCDSDGIADGIEDTNGNGVFDPGVDTSGICDVCDPLGINMFSATLVGGDTLTMCGAVDEDSIALMVNLTGGWSPFVITLEGTEAGTGTTSTLTFTDYEVGDRIYVAPSTTTTYRMTNITDSPPTNDQGVTFCTINPDSLFESIEITVEGPLTIDAGGDPNDFTACNLDTLGFGVHASNGGEGVIQYQWQLSNDDTNWTDVIDGTPYAFATTDSLIISNPLGLDGTYYRAKVFTETCDTIFTASAQLGVDGPFIIDTEPIDQILCAEEDNVFFHTETSVGQGVFNRRWQVSEDNGATWNDVVADAIYSFGSETVAVNSAAIQDTYHDTLYVTGPTFDMDQWQFRLAAIGQNTTACSEIYSDEATLTVEGVISIAPGNQPIDVQICSDTTACFGVTVDSESSSGVITYQWQVQERGSATWENVSNDGTYSGARSDTLCVTNVLGRDDFTYRVLVETEYCATITSGEGTLNVDGPISFETNAQDVTVCAEEDPNIFAVETWMGQGTLDRRWQISTDTGQTWIDLTIAGVYSTGTAATANPAPGFETAHFDTLYINTATSDMDQYQYRIAAIGQNSNNCEDVYSLGATLTVEGPITFAVQPVDVEICSDTTACFGVTIASESVSGLIEYQWYVQERGDAGNWSALSNDGTYSGVRSDTLCVTNPLGRDSFLYRVEVRTGLCATITSDSAILRIDGPISFNLNADDVTVCAKEDPNFFAFETWMGQGILDRRWQVSTDTGQTWNDVVIGGIYSTGIDSTDNPAPGFELAYQDTLYIDTASFDMNQWQYRLAAIGKNSNNCTDTYSREATLTVEGELSITVQPVDVSLCADTAACFGVSIMNDAMQGNVLYQWYKLDKGEDGTVDANWDPLSSSDGRYAGVRADTLCVLFVAGQDSTQYRVGIRTNLCNEVLSESAVLNVDGPIDHIVNPQDETICAVEDPIFFTSATSIGQGRMLTRWEISTDTGQTWANVNLGDPIYSEGRRIDEDPSTGAVEDSIYYDTLFISDVVFGMNQYRYRNVASGITGNGCDDVPSESAILTVEGLITVTDQPDNVAICSDTAACFGIATFNETGEGIIQYQWQTKPPNTSNWITLTSSDGRYGGVKSDTLCVNNVAGLDSFLYRVLISTGTCANVASDSAMLSVAGPVDYVAEPQDVSICAAEDATFFNAETTIGQGGLTTRWEVSTDTGQTWAVVDDTQPVYTIGSRKEMHASSTIDSVYYDTLHINAVATSNMDGWLYRLVSSGLNGTSCKDIPSESGKLTVNGPLTVADQPDDVVTCSGKPALFAVNIANESSGATIFQWQASNDNITWVNIPANNSIYNGSRDSVLSISNVANVVANDRDSIYYRVGYSTTFCGIQFSDAALLKVEGPFEFGDPANSPHDTVVCSGEQVIFNANPTNLGFGEMIFEWKVFTAGDWKTISDGLSSIPATFTGENTTQLVIDLVDDTDAAVLDSALFRLDVTSAECDNAIESLTALLRIDGSLNFATNPRDTVNCADKGVIFFATVENNGFGGRQSIQYRWQEYEHNTMTWRDIENEGVYNGASTDTLSIDITTGLDSNQYRLVAWTNVCNSITSDPAYLIEEGNVNFTDHPIDVIICSGENTEFDARVVNSTGQGDNVLNWQMSTNNGISWVNIDTSQVKDGNKLFTFTHTGPTNTGDSTATELTSNLAVSDVEGMQGYRFRTAVTSTYCDTVFSQLAKLTVEGPFTATLSGDNDICANIGTTIAADVVNLGAGLPVLTWQYKGPDSTDFADVPNDAAWGIFHGEVTNGVGVKVLTIDSVLNQNSRENLATTDTFWTLNNYQFRLHIVSDTCEVAVYSDTFTLRVVSDQIGRCDWDLDGLDNDTDLDDDNDRLTDSVEVYITTGPGSEPSDSLFQFDTDTDNDGISDAEEDADDDTISNGEEVDDDNGNGIAEGIDPTTGEFFGEPAGNSSDYTENLYPLYNDPDTPGDIFNGDPLNPCDPILSPSCIGVVLDINVKLQGAMPDLGFDETDAVLMTDELRKKALLPRTSPYDKFFVLDSLNSIVPAFVQVERDSVLEEIPSVDSAAVFGPQGFQNDDPGNAVVDWVFVEIRDASKLDSVVTTRAALLQRDGDVRDHRVLGDTRRIDPDGYSYLSFDSTLAGDYYVVVRHRNHLGVMTNQAGLYSPIVTRVDFTDGDFNALGIHSQRMNADSTEQYMWAGDVTSDRKVIYQGPGNDVDEMFFRVIAEPGNVDLLDNYIVPGYYRTDYNLDGKSIFQGPENDRQMLIFQSILQFPDNKLKRLANYVILEQLP